jgi:hypothetical protein
MPNHIIRGTITFPFEARVNADSVTTDFDLFTHYGVDECYFGFQALEDSGPLSDAEYGVTIDDYASTVRIDTVEVE